MSPKLSFAILQAIFRGKTAEGAAHIYSTRLQREVIVEPLLHTVLTTDGKLEWYQIPVVLGYGLTIAKVRIWLMYAYLRKRAI